MLALVNPRCDYGRGLRTWRRVEGALRAWFRDLVVEEMPGIAALPGRLDRAFARGERRFVAAGGDGTVNLLANALLDLGHPDAILGAVALGSSNDFHKPARASCVVRGVPVKLNWEQAMERDVIMVAYHDRDTAVATRACLINAGIGITAFANAIYSSRRPAIDLLQRVTVEGAILASIGYAIKTFRPLPCELFLGDDSRWRLTLTNLAVLKSPHVGGALCYDTPVAPDDGRMPVAMCVGMTRWETLRALMNLYRHRFTGLPKTASSFVSRLSVASRRRFAVEMDGEVIHAVEACFTLAPGALRCCP